MLKSLIPLLFLSATGQGASEPLITARKVKADLSKDYFNVDLWKDASETGIELMAQPMIAPRPKVITTERIRAQAIHDGKWIAFRLRWKDSEKSEAGRPGEFSDAVALQFPIKEDPLPPIFMGFKDQPVHLFHWRAQYQKDHEQGKPEMRDLYPNMNPDMYPMEFKDEGSVRGLTAEKREVFSHGKAAGNPQAYVKPEAVDEIFAEGFGSSSIIENRMSAGHGQWKNGQWTVVISREMQRENGSLLDVNKSNHMAFAVWQGGKDEVGSRKSLTMMWVPLNILGEGDNKAERVKSK